MTASDLEGGSPGVDRALDAGVIERLVTSLGEDGPALITGVIDTFLDEAPRLLAALRQAVADDRAADAGAAAHSLKGSAAALGAIRLSQECARLETAATADDIVAAAALVGQVEQEHALAMAGLQRTIDVLRSRGQAMGR